MKAEPNHGEGKAGQTGLGRVLAGRTRPSDGLIC